MPGRVEWNGAAMQARIRKEMNRRLAVSSKMVRDHAKELISVSGTGGGVERDEAGRFIKGTYKPGKLGSNPSRPGEPPHKQTGRLRGSVADALYPESTTARVGTNVKYGRWLELGAAHMAARPWLRRALLERAGVIRSILTKPIGGTK
jgi:phage gpG-like protein